MTPARVEADGAGSLPLLTRRARWVLFAILALAVVVRLAHFLEIRDCPFAVSPVIDARQFLEMGRAVATGKGIGAAQKAPLYPLLLGLMFTVGGVRPLLAIGVQLAAGVLTCVLIFMLGRRLFGTAAGLAAAGWAAVYRPFPFFEGQLLATWLAVLLVVLFLLVLWRAGRSPGPIEWLGVGGVLGLALLVRGNLLLMIPFALAWLGRLVYRRDLTAGAALGRAALLAVGCLVPLLPAAWHNRLAGGPFVPTPSTAGINLYTGNHVGADGYSAIPVHSAWEAAMDEARAAGARDSWAISAYWTRRTFEEMGAHPWAEAALLVRKLALFWDAFEYPNNVSFAFMQRFSRVLRWPVPGFGLLAPLALAALFVLRRESGTAAMYLGLFVLFYMASVILFFSCDRYRLPVVPALLCLAGGGVAAVARRLRHAPRTGVALPAALALVIALPVNLDLYGARPAMPRSRDLVALGDSYRYQGRLHDAAEAYRQATEADPRDPDARALLGQCLWQSGRPDLAEAPLREALELRPGYVRPRALLARILFEAGRLDEAVPHLRVLAARVDASPEPHYLLSECYRRAGDQERARAEYLEARRIERQNGPDRRP